MGASIFEFVRLNYEYMENGYIKPITFVKSPAEQIHEILFKVPVGVLIKQARMRINANRPIKK